METTHTYSGTHTSDTHGSHISWLSRIESSAEFSRYGIISVAFLLIGTLGGIVVGFFAHDHLWKIATVVGFTMLSLTLMLAVAPMKHILRAVAATLLADILLMVLGLI
jgi:hypothetical protein